MTAGEAQNPGSVNYPDPILDMVEDVRNIYLPEMTALTCPEGVNTNGGKFAGSIKCRPFTKTLQDEALAAAAASAQNACDAVRSQMNFRCDMSDCSSIKDVDGCASTKLCSWTPDLIDKCIDLDTNETVDMAMCFDDEGRRVNTHRHDTLPKFENVVGDDGKTQKIAMGFCTWNTQLTTNAINACMGNNNECKAGNSVFDGFNGLACETYGKARKDVTYNGKDFKKDDMRPFSGQYTVKNGQFMCKKLADGEKSRTNTPSHPSGKWPVPQTDVLQPAQEETTATISAEATAEADPKTDTADPKTDRAEAKTDTAEAKNDKAEAKTDPQPIDPKTGTTTNGTQLNRSAVNLQCLDDALGC